MHPGQGTTKKTQLVTRHHEESRCGAPMGHGKYIHATGRAPPYTTGATNKYEFGYKQSSVQARCALRAAWGRWEWSSDPDEGCQGGPRGYTTGLREILGFWCVRPGGAEGSDEYDPSETTGSPLSLSAGSHLSLSTDLRIPSCHCLSASARGFSFVIAEGDVSLASSEWGPGPTVSVILPCVQKTPRIGRDSCNGEARRQKTSTALLTARLSSKFLCTTTLKHPLIWRHASRLFQH